MIRSAAISRSRRLPLLGLLLSLLLHVGSGALAAGHLHDEVGPPDHPCTVCLLAAATTAAAAPSLLPPVLAAATACFHPDQFSPPSLVAALPRARAPPALLI